MLKRETKKTYERKTGGTVLVVTSVCPEDEREDMIDALITLVKRDIEELAADEK